YTSIDPFDQHEWRNYKWLPYEYDAGPRLTYFDTQLAKAKQLDEVLQGSSPSKVGIVKIVSDVFATNLYLLTPESDPSWKNWTFIKAQGDGTVPAWSAANNPDSLEGTIPSFSVHSTIFNDPTVENVLKRELLNV